MFARGGAAEQVGARAWLQALLDVEAALARACAGEGLIPQEAADAIAAACVGDRFDVAAIGAASARGGNPVIPLVEALREQAGADAAAHVHHGATSQDILDSAMMLVARRALEPVLADAGAAASACAALAEAHRDTVMIGRTLLQQAMPTTFGLKAAGWLTGIDEARDALVGVVRRRLAVQLGGAVGTLSGYGNRGIDVAAALARELGLVEPLAPWHGDRMRPAALAGALAQLAGALAKPARDVALLAQNEVGEVSEAGGEGSGGSSTMAHKRNPVAAVAVLGCTTRVPGLVATMHAAMAGEHERAAGAWHAEWETVSDLLRLTGSAAAWAREMLEGLEVDAGRMRANLAAAGDAIPAARAPEEHLGAAGALIDRALAAHRERGG